MVFKGVLFFKHDADNLPYVGFRDTREAGA